MGLRGLNLQFQYRSDRNNLLNEFYIPCLSASNVYQRAVGYFTSTSLALAARGLAEFVRGDGRMQLIASPKLEPDDISAISLGYEARTDVVARCLLRNIDLNVVQDDFVKKRLGLLAWLVAHKRLDIKIVTLSGQKQCGIYHEKLGVFKDRDGNVVAFTGSANETEGGLVGNFEIIDVFCSWREGDQSRVVTKTRDFDELWANRTPNLEVMDFPSAARDGLLKYEKFFRPGDPDPEYSYQKLAIFVVQRRPRIPDSIQLREYQKEAIRAWFAANGSGILEMATGTGKTITALAALAKLYEVKERLGAIVVAPYTHLVEQWADEVRRFGVQPVLAYGARESWEKILASAVTAYSIGASDHFVVITTNATFATDHMREIVNRIPVPSLLIADEMHHLGAQLLRTHLPPNIEYRLGLSATPVRWFDDEGTTVLEKYFRPGVVFHFGLREAIQNNCLCPYEYYPHLIELSPGELEEYVQISRRIASLVRAEEHLWDSNDPRLQTLLIARARILSRAEGKLAKLRDLALGNRASSHNLFYCGDAKVDGWRQLDRVVHLLGRDVGMKVHPFTSEESTEERRQLLSRFESGKLQGLVAIRCLDEGVDVPATRTAYILASSTNPREFVQRRGRILRLHPRKSLAVIHDFIVVPPSRGGLDTIEPELFNLERRLLRRELTRAAEFASLARNGPQAEYNLHSLKRSYNLLDL